MVAWLVIFDRYTTVCTNSLRCWLDSGPNLGTDNPSMTYEESRRRSQQKKCIDGLQEFVK
jgi:hypothetical protein